MHVGLADADCRAFDLHDPKNPWLFRRTARPHREAIARAVQVLDVERAARYAADERTYCNVYAADVCGLMGVPLPRCDPRDGGALAASDLRRWLDGDGRILGWTRLPYERARIEAESHTVLGWRPPREASSATGHLAIHLPSEGTASSEAICTFAGRVRRERAPVDPRELTWFAFCGTPTVVNAGTHHDRIMRRVEYVDWVIGRMLARAPCAPAFESSWLARALVAAEDRRFWAHRGVDPVAVARALTASARGERQGGSTLVQQLVRHVLGWYEVTAARKAVEVAVALLVARRWERRTLLWASTLVAYVGRIAPQGALGSLRDRFPVMRLDEAAGLAASLKYPHRKHESSTWRDRRERRSRWLVATLE